MKKILSLGVFCITMLSVKGQVVSESKSVSPSNSLGVELRSQYGLRYNYALVYRKMLKNPSWQFNAGFAFGYRDRFANNQNLFPAYFFETNDTSQPIIGVNRMSTQSSNYQNLEFGIEKHVQWWKLNFLVGIEGIVGHRKFATSGGVFRAIEDTTLVNGFQQLGYTIDFDAENLGFINSAYQSYNWLNLGARVKLGMSYDLSDRWFVLATIGFQLDNEFLIKSDYQTQNNQYLEHIPERTGYGFSTFDFNMAMGLHYKF